MIAAAFAMALLADPAAAPQDASLAGLVRAACVDTGMQRDAFDRLARDRRWRAAQVTSSGQGWIRAYLAGAAMVNLSQYGADVGSEVGSVCAVSAPGAEADLLPQVEALAVDLGLAAEGASPSVDGVNMRVWSKLGVYTLTYAARRGDPRATVSLSRQTVVTAPQGAAQ